MGAETKERRNELTAAPKQQGKLLSRMADERGIDAETFHKTLCATVMPSAAKQEDVVIFLLICERYGFDPFAKHVFAFPGKSGGIQPVVSVDGWIHCANSHEAFDGIEFSDTLDEDGNMVSITCRIHRKDRSFPITCTEYMEECCGTSDPWKRWPRRMLRHKATIQAIRIAFGISGVMDEDEYERMRSCTVDAIPDSPRIERSRMREVELPEVKTNGISPVVTSQDFRKLDLPGDIIDLYTKAVDAGDLERIKELTADGIAHSGDNEKTAAQFQAAGDAARAEVERGVKPKGQKELV